MADFSSDMVFPPARAGAVAMQEFRRMANAPYHLDWGIRDFDEYVIPMQPGDVVSLLARPGHTKTSTLIHLAKRASVLASTISDNAIAVVATWETTVEEFVGLLTAGQSGQSLEQIARGQADLQKVEEAIVQAIVNRVYIFGRSRKGTVATTSFTLQIVDDLLRGLIAEGKNIILLGLDYLQRIPGLQVGMNPRDRVTVNMDISKDIALQRGCPVVIPVQAKRDVDDLTGLKMPRLNDPQWSSDVEQASDKVIALTRPCLYMAEGSMIVTDQSIGAGHKVTDSLLVAQVLKQRWGKAGEKFFMRFDVKSVSLTEAALFVEEVSF